MTVQELPGGGVMGVTGLNVVVTGKIAGETRVSAEAKLREAGATVQARVTGDTDLLVTGEAVGATKIAGAEKHGALVRTWHEVMGNGGAAAPPPPVRVVDETRLAEMKAEGATLRQIAPMLCKSTDRLPGDGWLYEVKWDGYRCVAVINGGFVRLWSRSGKPLSFPHIEEHLADQPDSVLDGEVVVVDENGNSDFAALGDGHRGARFIVFDVLEVEADGHTVDLRGFPLEARKAMLDELIPPQTGGPVGPVEQSPVFEDGVELVEVARERQLEGIVAKRKDSKYREGARGPEWLKFKLRQEQEFVVLGWTDGKNGNTGHLGALILGVAEVDGCRLLGYRYCGRVGTGWTDEEGDRLLALLRELDDVERGEYGGVPSDSTHRSAHYIVPSTVVQVEFQRWTKDGALWHPSYKRQRDDKKPSQVVRET